MSDPITFHEASYESPAESFSVKNPYSFVPSSNQLRFQPSEDYNYSYSVPDSEITGYPVHPSFMPEPETPPPSPSLAEASSFVPEALDTSAFAAPAAYATNSLLSFQASKTYQSDMLGGSQAGHSFLAAAQANSNLQTHELQNSIASTLVGAGAMFGPEGLAVGALAGAAVSSMDFTSTVTAPTDTGQTVSADQIAT